jgi:L-lactate dehydrogenase
MEDVSLSLPTVIDNNGIRNVLEIKLNKEEKSAFINFAKLMKEVISKLNI